MDEASVPENAPLVLVINDEEWVARTIESILKPRGYAVRMAYTGRQGVEMAAGIEPDLLFVDLRLPDTTGPDLCRRLRKLPAVRPSTPIVLFTSGPVTRRDRIEGFEAGAWAVLQPPFEPEELLAQLVPLVEAKRDADHALEMSHLDPVTGFYNLDGLLRRAAEISADTVRTRRPLACVALGPSTAEEEDEARAEGEGAPNGEENGSDPTQHLGNLLLSITRLSDAVARVGENDFVIVAPGTDRDGAVRLAERVMEAVDAGNDLRKLRLKAGYYTVLGSGPDAVLPEELLRRATAALRDAQARQNGVRIHPANGAAENGAGESGAGASGEGGNGEG